MAEGRVSHSILAGMALLVLATGCAGTSHFVRSYPAPSPDDLLHALRARQAALSGMNVETRATSWLGGQRVRGTVQMLVARGGRLRFEAEEPLQGTVAALAVEDGRFTFFDNQKHVFREGPACPANVAALIRIPLAPAEVAPILLGDAPLSPGVTALGVAWDSRRGADVLALRLAGGTMLWLGMRRPNPQTSAWDIVYLEGKNPEASARWRVSYQDFARAGDLTLPRVVRFAEPGKSFDDGVEIDIRDRIVNPTFPARAFVLDPPSGYTIEHAACGAPE